MSIMELTAEFKYSKTQQGITVSRAYVYDPEDTNIGTAVIPAIGSVFAIPTTIANITDSSGADVIDIGFQKIFCRTQETSPLAGHPAKLLITCSYTNEPVDDNIFIRSAADFHAVDVNTIPKTIENAGEFVVINPTLSTTNDWTWEATNEPVLQPVPYRVNTSNVRITRMVASDYFDILQTRIKALVGTVNDTANPLGSVLGGGAGCWLFTGASSEMFRNHADIPFYKVDFDFSYRSPNFEDKDGWQLLLKLDGSWDRPVDKDGNYIYTTTDFSKLWNRLDT